MNQPAGKILTGAPKVSDLDWSEDAYVNASHASSFIDNSQASFSPYTSKFRSIGELPDERRGDDGCNKTRESARPARSDETPATLRAPSSTTDIVEDTNMIDAMAVVTVPVDMMLGILDDDNENDFLSTGKRTKFVSSSMSDKVKENKEYLEQSFMFYDNSLSTTISLTPSFDSETTQESTQPLSTTESLTSTPTINQLPTIQLPSPIIDLKKLPNAVYINQIAPQTITVNLIVGVVNIAAPRNIKLRRTDRKMDLVEMIVADETRAGFQISFWLPADPERKDSTRKTLKGLKPKDLILLKNVALHVWNGRVFGQSLRKGWTKTETTVTIWACNGVLDVQLPEKIESPEDAKLQRVFDYAEQYFLPRPVQGWVYATDKGDKSMSEDLPPETQSPKRQTRRGTDLG